MATRIVVPEPRLEPNGKLVQFSFKQSSFRHRVPGESPDYSEMFYHLSTTESERVITPLSRIDSQIRCGTPYLAAE
jgi:hypothetical protein